MTDFSALQGDQVVLPGTLGPAAESIRITRKAAGTTVWHGAQSMRHDGVTQPFELGKAIKFEYQPSFDFL